MMEQSLLYVICGYVASVGLILGYLPQAISTIRTRKTDGIAMPTFLMMAIGAGAFMFITNLITCGCSCIIFGIKLYNDWFRN